MSTENILEEWPKEPGEIQDYDIDFKKYLRSMGEGYDAAHTVTAEADDGITVDSVAISGGVAKVWLSGGTDGEDYLVVAKVITAGGRKKFGHILIQVRQTTKP